MFASTVRYERFMIWEKVFDWSSRFNDRFLKMSLLRFYPGATPEKKETNCNWRWKTENRKKKQVYENIRSDRKFYSKWQTERPWLDVRKEKKRDDMHYMHWIWSDKISNPFISGCSNLRVLSVTDHGEALRCRITTYKIVPIEKSTPTNIIFDTQTDIIESVQETVFINDD
jgi:hypothetical protein